MDDKFWRDLHKVLEKQDFKNEEEIKTFLDGLIGQKIPELADLEMNDEETARELIYKARELSPIEARQNIEDALLFDPNCIDAYELLGSFEEEYAIAICFYKRGVDIGKEIFGGRFLDEHKGKFWGFHETRPFMRCMFQYADCLYNIDKKKDCIVVLEELIELNPNDNQGVRDQLMLFLVELNEFDKYRNYAAQFEDDFMAFSCFNKALFAFKTEGESENSNSILKHALEKNKFVAKKLISSKPQVDFPGFYGIGDNNEAIYYAVYAQDIWQETDGAIEWLKKHSAAKNKVPTGKKNKG